MKDLLNVPKESSCAENSVTDLSKTSRCFKLLVYAFRLSGVEVDYSRLNVENRRRRYLLLAWAILCWLIGVIAKLKLGATVYYDYAFEMLNNPGITGIAFFGSAILDYLCTVLFGTAVHAAILVNCTQECWLKLWKNLQHTLLFKGSAEEVKRTTVYVMIFLFAVSELIC